MHTIMEATTIHLPLDSQPEGSLELVSQGGNLQLAQLTSPLCPFVVLGSYYGVSCLK